MSNYEALGNNNGGQNWDMSNVDFAGAGKQGIESLQDGKPTELERVLSSMSDSDETMERDDNSESAKILQVYEAFMPANDKDRQNAEGAIDRALRKNGKTVFENLCNEINNQYISSDKNALEDFGAFDVASSIITANCIKKMEDNEDKEIGCAEALIFQNRAYRKIAHPDVYPALEYEGRVLGKIVGRYKQLRGNGETDQSFVDFLKSLSTNYGVMAHSVQISGEGHIDPEQIAEWRAIGKIIERCQFLKKDQSVKDKNLYVPMIGERQEDSRTEQESDSRVERGDELSPANSFNERRETTRVGEPLSQWANTKIDDTADPEGIQERFDGQIRQRFERISGYLSDIGSLIQKMSLSNLSPSVEKLQVIIRNMSNLLNLASGKIDERASDEEYLDLLDSNLRLKTTAMLNDGINEANGIYEIARQYLHSKEMSDFLNDDVRLIALLNDLGQELTKD